METWINSRREYAGKIFSVRVGEVRLDNGTSAVREIVEHRGGVATVPVINDSVLLIRQFRIAVGRRILELPAGRIEGQETPEYRAREELEEELGYRAERMILLTSYYSSAGFTDEKMTIYLGLDLEETEKKPEWDEQIETVPISIAKVTDMLAADQFDDAKTIIGLHAFLSHLAKFPEILEQTGQ